MSTVRVERAAADPNADAGECQVPPVATGEVDAPDDDTLAAMAKAIAHPTRLAILRLLIRHDACVTGDLVAEFPLAQSTVSEHLRILRQADLIQGVIEGPRTRYCVNPDAMAALRAGIAAI